MSKTVKDQIKGEDGTISMLPLVNPVENVVVNYYRMVKWPLHAQPY